ncbi:MAG TPA: hypothetical protein VGP72_21100 [Planctomycetota bacterium]|jgi:hypothetical protein
MTAIANPRSCPHTPLLCLLLASAAFCADTPVKWEPVGLSGGGGMFTPAISPLDPKLMMINCDMSAAYISCDGGLNWKMIHQSQLRANTQCKPAFHPADANAVLAANGNRLMVSRDRGEHWELLANLPQAARGDIGIDPGDPKLMLIGSGESVLRSDDGGKTWARCEGPRGEVKGFHFDQTSPATARVCFAGTSQGIWRSDDCGKTWAAKTASLPSSSALAFAGGSNAKDNVVMLYCTVPSKAEGGKFTGGPYRSSDKGEHWESALGAGLNVEIKRFDQWSQGDIAQYKQLATSNAQPKTVYAFNTNTGIPPPHNCSCFRSDDGGQNWKMSFQGDPRWPPFNVEKDFVVCGDGQFYQCCPLGVAACATNAELLLTVDVGNSYVTRDGAKNWQLAHSRTVAPAFVPAGKEAGATPRWHCTGLVVTTTWNYYVDPFKPERHYICYTDIGFSISNDRAKTWSWWPAASRPPWRNTCYELAFDPEVKGKVWGAFSDTHDIPNGNIIWGNHRDQYPGGVAVSVDHADKWKASNAGLPKAACTSIALDPKSPAGQRTLYCGVFNQGVFKSTDDGKSWTGKNKGLGADSNRRVCRVFLHTDGTLFALVTARTQNHKFLSDGVGLYRSKDGAENWELLNKSQALLWPKDFTVDPKDSQRIYVGACDAREGQAGLWRTADGGATWKRLLQMGSEHFGAYLHPKRPGWIYATLTEGAPGAGLWLSKDDGATWKALDGLPFSNAQRVVVDPDNDAAIFVTTFGGSVWHGPAEE